MSRFPKPRKLAVPVKPPKGHFFFAGHTIERVKWWTSGPMRKLYFLLVVMVCSNIISDKFRTYLRARS
ncbi:unnamed protein product [Aureobasidium mustum]|uniref:Uncharacterized protein n=1 Tax=Aureobasidium mustum TaxID=2773714 RepID=A0A9N8JI14_9PEZI|nr:unnamed protein product [Aureobasidium mustum]